MIYIYTIIKIYQLYPWIRQGPGAQRRGGSTHGWPGLGEVRRRSAQAPERNGTGEPKGTENGRNVEVMGDLWLI